MFDVQTMRELSLKGCLRMSESILQIKKGYDGMRAFLFDIDPEMSM